MQSVITIKGLPDSAVEASQDFGRNWLPDIREQLAGGRDVIVVLPTAPYDHADWRRALVRDLARAHSPQRVNFISGKSGQPLDETVQFLQQSPGVTGQYLALRSVG